MYPPEDGLLAETCQGWINYQRQITLDGFISPYIQVTPSSNGTMGRRTAIVSEYWKKSDQIKESTTFALQTGQSTDIGGKLH
jgi:hypothetical protein